MRWSALFLSQCATATAAAAAKHELSQPDAVPKSLRMKLMLVFTLLVVIAGCWAAPQAGKDAEVLEYEVDNIGIGGYKFSYKLSDGTTRTEEATVNNPGAENESLSVRGSISWVAPDGQTYTINFVADENGFQPEGEHIPK